MDKDKQLKEIQSILSGKGMFKALSIDNVNHKPHPFCIGAEYIKAYALDTSSGCAMRVNRETGDWSTGYKKGYDRCGLSKEEHKSDRVVFLQLMRNMTKKQAQPELKRVAKYLERNGIDGITLVETEEKFRIK